MCTAFVTSAVGAALGSYLASGGGGRRGRGAGHGHGDAARRRRARVDWTDVIAYAVHGGLVNAPLVHCWFEWLRAHGPASDTGAVLVDQLAVQPPLLVRE